MKIRVGIMTAGPPQIEKFEDGRHRLKNQLIGKDFHWQRTIESVLPGEIEILEKRASDEIILVNILDLEEYLQMVIGSEMNPDSPEEFLKCHAILSRSWVVGKILGCHQNGHDGKVTSASEHIGWDDTADHQGFHVCADDHCQRYQGENCISPTCQEAIRSTEGIIMIDRNGHPLDARFSKCCGGRTEYFSTCWQDIEPAGIESVYDPWCDLSTLSNAEREKLLSAILKDYDASTTANDFYRWKETVDKRLPARRLEECFGIKIGEMITTVIPEQRGISGRLNRIRIIGEKGKSISIGKELHIRRIFSESHLKSSAFDLTDAGDKFIITGKGWGHGVGLCQIGAARMALTHNHEEILRHYFPEGRISKLSNLNIKNPLT